MAEEIKNQNNVTDEQNPNVEQEKDDNKPSVEDLMAEIAKLKADGATNKKALDKALKEKGEITKQLRARQTAEEQAEEARKEEEAAQAEKIKSLEEFQAKTLAKERYLLQGMDVETASKAAQAEIENDMDLLSTIQKQFRDAEIKNAKNEWLASIPEMNAGVGTEKQVTKEQFEKMDIAERTELKRSNYELYKQLVGK